MGLVLIVVTTFAGMCFLRASSELFQKITTYCEVQKDFDECDEGTLITFDVDDTLITAKDVAAGDPNNFTLWFKIRSFIKYPAILHKEKMRWVYSVMFQQSERFVFDPNIVSIIQSLQRKKYNIIALTAMESGALGVIESMPKWRAEMLKNFGIDFSGEWRDMQFTSLPSIYGNCPCLYRGILCTNRVEKGRVLGAFLDSHSLIVTRIVSFDDDVDALRSIADECAKRRVLFSGYQILGAKKLSGTWNTARALVQLDSIMEQGHWLTDKEADMTKVLRKYSSRIPSMISKPTPINLITSILLVKKVVIKVMPKATRIPYTAPPSADSKIIAIPHQNPLERVLLMHKTPIGPIGAAMARHTAIA